jgi:potassium efflux system protein
MKWHSRAFINVALLLVALNLALIETVKAVELTIELTDARLNTLRASANPDTDKTLKAYESTRTWLIQAASHDREAANYVDTLISAPKQEAEFQMQLDVLEAAHDTLTELETLSPLELKAQQTGTSTELRNAINELDTIKQRLAARETAAHLIRTRLDEIAQRLDLISTLDVPVTLDPHAPPSIAEALQWITVAEQIALIAERQAQEANLASQPDRFSALRAKTAVLELQIRKLVVKNRTLETIERQMLLDLAAPTTLGIGLGNPIHAIAKRLTLDNTKLHDERLDIELLLNAISTNQVEVDRVTRVLEDRFTTARRVVDFAPDSDVLGRVLLAYWEEIETFRLPTPADRLPQKIGNNVISRIQHDEELSKLASATSFIMVQINAAGLDPTTISAADKGTLVELARYKRKLLRNITDLESDYIEALRELKGGYNHLRELVKDYKEYLEALVLWIPSRQLLWTSDLGNIPGEMARLLSGMAELVVVINPLFLVALIVVAVLLFSRTRLREINHSQDRRRLTVQDDSLRITIIALIVAGLRASPVPMFLFAISILISQNTSPVGAALSGTLNGLVVVVFVLDLMRILSEESGVARTHFGWRSQTCSRLYVETSLLIGWWLPCATLASFLFLVGDDAVLLGRLTLLFTLFLLGGHLIRRVWRDMQIADKQGSMTEQNRLRLILIVILIAVIVGIVWGLRYSVSIVTSRLIATLWIGVGLLIAHNLLLRWLYLVRRRMYHAERLVADTEPAIGEARRSVVAEEEANLINIGAETRRLLNATTLSAAVVALLYLWTPLFPVVDALARVTLWTSTTVVDGESVTTLITLETLVLIIFLVVITFYAARRLPALAELALRSRTSVTRGSRYAASTLLSYGIVGIGTVIALSALGLRWSQLQWLIAALGVGIGFGLQEIIANFISGLIILFERPIRVGDIVTVGDKDGIVTKIRIRATTIRDFDGRELLVPNKEFITGRLLNWSLSDSKVRLVIPVGIAYGSNLKEALSILRQITDEYPDILDDPKPSIIFGNFGENALELTARFFIGSFDDYWRLTTGVRSEIYERFNEAGIVIAYPQRDVHFDSEQPIRISIDAPETANKSV